MVEHFNENYAESDKYPKATFKGKIANFSIENLSENPATFKISGALTFHGETKKLKNVPVEISMVNNLINISGSFVEKASNYDIEIPKIVSKKIADDIDVSFKFALKLK